MSEQAAPGTLERSNLTSLVINSVNGWSDATSLYGQAGRVAEDLGYDDEVVRFAWGMDAGEVYVPGINDYTPLQHIRGVTSTVLEAPGLVAPEKAEALKIVADVAGSYVSDADSLTEVILSNTRLRHGTVHRAIMHEVWARASVGNIANHGPNQLQKLCQAADVQAELKREWHPYRRQVMVAGVAALGVAVWAGRHHTR